MNAHKMALTARLCALVFVFIKSWMRNPLANFCQHGNSRIIERRVPLTLIQQLPIWRNWINTSRATGI